MEKTVILLMGPDSTEKTKYTDSKKQDRYTVVIDEPTLPESIRKLQKVLPKPLNIADVIYIKHPFLTMQSRFQVWRAIKQSGVKCKIEIMLFDTLVRPYEMPSATIYHYQGGDTDVVLASRSNSTESNNSNTLGNINHDFYNRCNQLLAMEPTKTKNAKALELLFRLRSKISPRARRSLFSMVERKTQPTSSLVGKEVRNKWNSFTTSLKVQLASFLTTGKLASKSLSQSTSSQQD